MRAMLIGMAMGAAAVPSVADAQATTRPCGGGAEAPGPACLLATQRLATPPRGPLYWHVDRFPSAAAAERAAVGASTVAAAFGSAWLFTLARRRWRARGGEHVAAVGPLPVTPASSYAAEYLRSIFTPGMSAPLHVHSGPEAFVAVAGDTCLETPEGAQIARGPGNALMIRAGPPMLLMAIGTVPRQGFALVLHDAGRPATTLTMAWQPPGRCAQQLAADRAQ